MQEILSLRFGPQRHVFFLHECVLIQPTDVVGFQAFAIAGSEPWRGDRDAGLL
jgi:hypothetical protein